jgi:hypothetical protein
MGKPKGIKGIDPGSHGRFAAGRNVYFINI